MINTKDVIRMKVPYPNVSSELAATTHMYICKENTNFHYEFIKCQTLKPYMLINNPMQHYCDENVDITRNPFQRATRIDCDKIFVTATVKYDDMLKTTTRPDVSEELFTDVLLELNTDGYMTISLNENELKNLNPLITDI